MQCSINALAACLTLAGVVLLVTSRSWRVGARLAWAAVLLVALGVLAGAGKPWDPKLLSAGVYMTPQVFLSEGRYVATGRELSQQRLLYFAEGNTCAVSVVEGDGLFKSLRVDGKVQISTWTSDRRIGRLMGHLPMLLHPQPHTVFNLGLGGGLTVAAMAAHPVTRIDVAEIEPLVVNAAREFAAENRHVLDDARLRLIFNDGRNHILLTDQRYDVITSDPIEPIVAGVGNLFSREYFRLCRDRLAPDGLMCQWVPLYELGPRHFDSIVNAFAAAFPHIMIWFTGTDTILIGSMEPLAIDFERLAQRVSEPSVQRDLQDIGMADANRILGAFCYEIARGDKCNPAAPTNTDDFPFIEFSTPKERWQPTLQLNIQNLFRLKQSLPAHVSFPNAAARQQAEQFFRAHQLALRAMIENQRAEWDRAFAFAQEARALDPQNPAVIALLVGWHVDQAVRAEKVNDTARMLEHYRSAAALDPKEFGPQMRLAWANTERQEWSEAESWLQRALQLAPRAIEARLCAAIIRNGKGDTDGAGDQLRALLQDYPTHPGALLTLAQIEMRLSAFGDAEQRIRLALEQDARDADAHWLLAQLFAATQRPQLARKHFRHALHYGGLIYEQRAASDSVFQRTMRGAH
jgi:spermidine synthase/tetratricopeptide (TPR) repeat protein